MERFILTSIGPVTYMDFAFAPPSGTSRHAAQILMLAPQELPGFSGLESPNQQQ